MSQDVQFGSLPLSSFEEAILNSLLLEERYGLEIIDAIKEISEGKILINVGTLYPTLRQLEKRKIIESRLEDKRLEARRGKARKYYKLTSKGRNLVENMNYMREQLTNWKPS
ncbi:helix-turn-helix transcriptional regulator [Scytonema hofmannii FACHB-248]|uniref:Helix-turn-helix transcriptional regulator n=1 Tax=Scytonema hofmannii FACHB-248 TaxID=1842502 RepID=A0ABR8GU09_9CYAN|nr:MULTISPECIES: PadR family transcriptional regulator [Nostocales]MBD2606992.1 helix-turn-helix transcriptional regulator [Scytonema hofmannii FACHB-248]